MALKLKKTYSIICEATSFEWKIADKNVKQIGKSDFTVLTPHLYGLVRIVCDGKVDIKAILRPTLANTNGYIELVELRNEAQRHALEPEDERARRVKLTEIFTGAKKAKVQRFSRKGGRNSDTISVVVNGTHVEMGAPLRADEPPRVKCDEDMLLACIEFIKFRIDSSDDVLRKRTWAKGDNLGGEPTVADDEQLDEDAEPADAGNPVDDTEGMSHSWLET
jgi:hypothetical protein